MNKLIPLALICIVLLVSGCTSNLESFKDIDYDGVLVKRIDCDNNVICYERSRNIDYAMSCVHLDDIIEECKP